MGNLEISEFLDAITTDVYNHYMSIICDCKASGPFHFVSMRVNNRVEHS